MSNLHRRVTGTPSPSFNMEDSGSQEPLLGRDLSNGEDDTIVTIDPREDDEAPDAPVQNGIRQADAINQVWSRAALILAYCL
ncbi:uncharacterized protein GGS22DRAFT_111725 [Annulohypoxylon maeteangense]|uniref:uncharacterized protein n=1 Tax=Annulohypoxylon maeteangense TaxID=1927788 RepID=UPI0020076A44|nr:uncharacterized protein GGS22DRAFT_111725 [Annulohypoxylon maeteangense]KAI0887597.1 hypothetical protein GGS22DRAFT_111725 [Annulohypoxylon maeteangense]